MAPAAAPVDILVVMVTTVLAATWLLPVTEQG